MPFNTPDNISEVLILIYLLLVIVLGLISLVTASILFKHAEKRSVASSVTTLYAILFALIVIGSIGSLLSLS